MEGVVSQETRNPVKQTQILLVEDDCAVQEALGLFFKDSFEVLPATTGTEALAILNCKQIAAVVLDYRLPDCTGLEVLTQIKSAYPSIPVVMITGCGSESVCASALKLGVRDYFSKPFNAFDLVGSVRRILLAASQTLEHRENVLVERNRLSATSDPSAVSYNLAIQKAIEIIQQRYWDRIYLSDVAQAVGMSRYVFSRRFKEFTGVAFRKYLMELRLEKAKELLPTKQLSLTQVAQIVGFGDLPRFDKLFKRHTGVPPSVYRTQAPA